MIALIVVGADHGLTCETNMTSQATWRSLSENIAASELFEIWEVASDWRNSVQVYKGEGSILRWKMYSNIWLHSLFTDWQRKCERIGKTKTIYPRQSFHICIHVNKHAYLQRWSWTCYFKWVESYLFIKYPIPVVSVRSGNCSYFQFLLGFLTNYF